MNNDFVKETDNKAREWLDVNFWPKHKRCVVDLEGTPEQFNPFDANFTGSNNQHYYLELKTRHLMSSDYSGKTAIEQDKFNKLLEHKGEVALLILFEDCICYFPPSKLFDAFAGVGILWNCPDEMQPATKKKGGYRTKAVGFFDTNKAIKYSYQDYGGTPDFVKPRNSEPTCEG